jgi:hypothetical protein
MKLFSSLCYRILYLVPNKIRCWVANNTSDPSINNKNWWDMPFGGNYRYLQTMIGILDFYKPKFIIETGTFIGTSTKFFSRYSGSVIFSIELNKVYLEMAKVNLVESLEKNVTLLQGNSPTVMKRLFEESINLNQKSFFYFDAHWEKHLPLEEEISLVIDNFKDFIIVIDDFKNEFDLTFSYDSYEGNPIDHKLVHSLNSDLVCFIPTYMSENEWAINNKPKSFGVVCFKDSKAVSDLKKLGLSKCCL